MLNSGIKNKYSNSRVVRKKNSERNKQPYPPPPFKLNGRSLTDTTLYDSLSVTCCRSVVFFRILHFSQK